MAPKPNLKQIILETERLFLREVNPEIIYNLFNYYTDEEICDFLGLKSENELEIERKKFEEGLTTYNITFKNFLLADKVTNRIIGKTGFHTWYVHHYRAEIGYSITDDRFLAKGYMTEANRALMKYGFEILGLNRIEAYIGEGNVASLSMIKTLGFTREGVLREHYFKDNRLQDSICFSLLLKEYNRMK